MLYTVAMVTSSFFFVDSKTITFCPPLQNTERLHYINLDYECRIPFRLLLCIYTNQSVGKESKCVEPHGLSIPRLRLRVDRPHLHGIKYT